MKKILTIAAVAVLAAVTSQAQGLVTIQLTTQGVRTNTTANVSGFADGANQYYFELLFSSNTSLASSANQIYGNTGNFALWTDSAVSGVNQAGLNRGKISANGSVSVTGWNAPGATYDNLYSVLLVGWSANYGTTWASVSSLIQQGALGAGYYGVTAVGTSFAGGGSSALPAVNVWGGGGSPATGISPQTLTLNQIAVPEPSTMALAALGGASLLLFRRRK